MISVVTPVSDERLYGECVRASLDEKRLQLVPVSTAGGCDSAAKALNAGMERSDHEIIVLCHQDVCFPADWPERLADQVEAVSRRTPGWGVLGTMGVTAGGFFAGHIRDRHGYFRSRRLPKGVLTLDENCLVIRKDSGLLFDESLGGWHLYGVDLCLQAVAAGLSNFAIDAMVEHRGIGFVDESYVAVMRQLALKWSANEAIPSVVPTTCSIIRLAGRKARLAYFGKKLARKLQREARRLDRGGWLS